MNYAGHRELFAIDDQFMLGDALLVKGVAAAGYLLYFDISILLCFSKIEQVNKKHVLYFLVMFGTI